MSTDLTQAQRDRLDEATREFRAAMAPLANLPWRAGRTLGTTLYAVTTPNWKQQENFGRINTPELAARAIADHNTVLDLEWLTRRFTLTVNPYDFIAADGTRMRKFQVILDDKENNCLYEDTGFNTLVTALRAAREWAEEEDPDTEIGECRGPEAS